MQTGSNTLAKSLSLPRTRCAAAAPSKMGLNMALFQRPPSPVLVMILTMAKLQALGFDSSDGTGLAFSTAKPARRIGESSGLETTEYQLNLFDSISAADQGGARAADAQRFRRH